MNYKIVTDMGSNFDEELSSKYDVRVIDMPVEFEDENGKLISISGNEMEKFYQLLRAKIKITTSCASIEKYIETFERILNDGLDVLYIGFSSALSSTCQTGRLAANELQEKYPQRKIVVVDSLCAALGEGLLVTYAAEKRDSGMTIEELAQWIVDNRLNLCHWFTVDDLFFLKRGGRITASTAVVGTVLNIKPIMHVDDEGRLTPVSKARGRSAALAELVNRMEKSALPEVRSQKIYISHGDCEDDARIVANLVKEKFGISDIRLGLLAPVISAHSGPGTVALFFMGDKR